MATLPIISPRIVGVAGFDSPLYRSYSLLQGAAYREGDLTVIGETGTVKTTPSGGTTTSGTSLATTPGPSPAGPFQLTTSASTFTSNNVTIAGSASASAPAQSYYVILTYTATTGTNETLSGGEFIINAAAGVVPSINVLSAGAPASAVTFAVYAGIYEGGEILQQATKFTTALGTPFVLSSPLVNSLGLNRAPSAVLTATVITGIALADSASQYALGIGGAFNVGGPGNLLGAWGTPPTLGPLDPSQGLVASLTNGTPLEISLAGIAWSNALVGQSVGLALDATSGYFVANTSGNAVATIINKPFGSNADVGQVGDINTRVQIVLNAANVI